MSRHAAKQAANKEGKTTLAGYLGHPHEMIAGI